MHVAEASRGRWAKMWGPFGRETRAFSRALGGQSAGRSEILVMGTPEFEPWHFVAHLSEEATRFGRPDLAPTLLRWWVPPNAPRHLSRSVDSVRAVTAAQTVLVIDPGFGENAAMLERVADAKHRGSRILTLHRGDDELVELSHETLSVDAKRPVTDFDLTQHVVTDWTARTRLP
jgi:hypothetical protein